jgi:hypothetical protein
MMSNPLTVIKYVSHERIPRVYFINLTIQDGAPRENQGTPSGDAGSAANNASPSDPNDLMHSVKGMYRILDLISETGSGGLGATQVPVTIHRLVN